jgi:ferredoxin
MSLKITEECINCGACQSECPNDAIYPGGEDWEFKGESHGAEDAGPFGATGFYSSDYYYIVTDKCTECKGYHDEPQCAAACPVACCVQNEDHPETEEELLAKKDKIHG